MENNDNKFIQVKRVYENIITFEKKYFSEGDCIRSKNTGCSIILGKQVSRHSELTFKIEDISGYATGGDLFCLDLERKINSI